MNGLTTLRRFTARAGPGRAGERCELCAAPLQAAHPHLVDRLDHRLCCACPPCALLFCDPSESSSPSAAIARYRRVGDRVRADPSWILTEERWASLGVPIRLAFVAQSSRLGRWIGFYPSPAGVAEAEIDQAAWSVLAAQTELLRRIEPDVEAWLVRGGRGGHFDSLVVPIDRCYELAALVRGNYRGFDGGPAVQVILDEFFARLSAVAEVVGPTGGGR